MDKDALAKLMRASFEANLSQRLARSSRVNLQSVIPSHWFSAATSECQSMFTAGQFYGAISVAQAYTEALSTYLCDRHSIGGNRKDALKRWEKLLLKKIVDAPVCDAARAVFSDRNDFHHLNKEVEQDYLKLEKRAEDCVNFLYTIESHVFAHAFNEGSIVPKHPERWPHAGPPVMTAGLASACDLSLSLCCALATQHKKLP